MNSFELGEIFGSYFLIIILFISGVYFGINWFRNKHNKTK